MRRASGPHPTIHAVSVALLAGYALWLLVGLPDYGVIWDVFLEFPRATAYLDHFLGDDVRPQVSPWHAEPYEQASNVLSESSNGCLPSLWAAFTGKVFFEWLGLLDPIDSYHLGLTLLWIAAAAHFYWRLVELHGARLALLASILLGLAPRIVGEIHNNMKDLPCMAFASAGFLELAIGVRRVRARHLVAGGLLFGAALASKFVAVFMVLPAAILLWAGLSGGDRRGRLRLALAAAAMPLFAAAVVFGHWPFLWVPPAELVQRLGNIREVITPRTGTGRPSIYPLAMTAITTPIPTLVGLGLAVTGSMHRAGRKWLVGPLPWAYGAWLLGFLALFSSGRIALFDGIRHFLLVWPPIAVVAAWGLLLGLGGLARLLRSRPRARRALFPALVALLLATSIGSLALYHPYEITYFNLLVGGLRGATHIRFGPSVLDFEPRDYWGTSLRRTMRWVNANLPPDAAVSFGIPPRVYDAYTLRHDLLRVPDHRVRTGRPHYAVFLNRSRWFGELEQFALSQGRLVHAETARGVPLALVYRLPD